MAITTSQGLISAPHQVMEFNKGGATGEVSGSWRSLWDIAYYPAAGGTPSPGIDGETCDNTTLGAFPLINPASGNMYLGGFSTKGSDNAVDYRGSLYLYDRLWQNSGITITTTTEQAIASGTLPARDRNGSTNGEDVHVFMEVSGTTGTGGAVTNTTLNYTNSAGTDTRTATLSHIASGGLVDYYWARFSLQAGDLGVRSIQGLTLGTTYTSGTVHLVMARLIARIDVQLDWDMKRENAIMLGMPRIYNSSCLFLVHAIPTVTAEQLIGEVIIVQG